MNDVARLAQVSVSTVSYVLTGTRPISQATRDKVLAAMTELDYEPNAMARGLASRRSRILGLLLPMDERGLGATETAFVTGAAAAASAAGYHLVLSPSGIEDLEAPRRLATQRMLDGALLMEVRLDDARVAILQEARVPFVLIGRTRDTGDLPFVDIDFEQMVRDAVAHLVGLGHTRIAYLNHSNAAIANGYGPAWRTQEAYVTAMAAQDLDPLMVPAEDTASAGRAAAAAMLAQAPDLTAIVAMNENAIFGMLGELSTRGLRVPDDISVVSMVTSPQVAELATPALTAMTSPGGQMVRLAVAALLDVLDGDAASRPPVQQLVPCALEVRGSTGPARRTSQEGSGPKDQHHPSVARRRAATRRRA